MITAIMTYALRILAGGDRNRRSIPSSVRTAQPTDHNPCDEVLGPTDDTQNQSDDECRENH